MDAETPYGGNRQNAFLNLLRASNRDFEERRTETSSGSGPLGSASEHGNADTVRAGNSAATRERTATTISDLFHDPKSPSAMPREAAEAGKPEEHRTAEDVQPLRSSTGLPPIHPRLASPSPPADLETASRLQQPGASGTTNGLPPRPTFLNGSDRCQSVVYTVDVDDELLNGEDIPLDDVRPYANRFEEPAAAPTASTQHSSGQPPPIGVQSPSTKTGKHVIDSFLLHQPNRSDGFSSRPDTIKRRDRGVSFEPDVMRREEPLSPADISYIHHGVDDRGLAAPSSLDGMNSLGSSGNSNNLRRTRTLSDNRVINLADILISGTYELEAETNILKALEDHLPEKARHQRFRSETSTILSGVPDSLGHDFSLGDDDGDDAVTSPPHSQEGTASDAPNSHLRGKTKAANDERMHSEDDVPLLKTEKRHQRTMSVEDRLAGLTVEYYNLEDNKGTAPKALRIANRLPDSVSSGDALRHNAALLSGADHVSSIKARIRTETSDKLPCLVEGDEETPQTGDEASNKSSIHDHFGADAENFRKNGTRRTIVLADAKDRVKEEWDSWRTFFNPRKENILMYTKIVFLYMGIPLVGSSVVLFYGFENPPTGLSMDGSRGDSASASWCLLFIMRQAVTLSLALFLQILLVDFFSIVTGVLLKILGPAFTLLIVQSKGWPFVLFWWSILDFAVLYGNREFARHWLFFQDGLGVFNAQNPSGHVVDSTVNKLVLSIVAIVSIAEAIKRFVVGLYLSRNTYSKFNELDY
jgi:hypothetical protein